MKREFATFENKTVELVQSDFRSVHLSQPHDFKSPESVTKLVTGIDPKPVNLVGGLLNTESGVGQQGRRIIKGKLARRSTDFDPAASRSPEPALVIHQQVDRLSQ